MAARVSVVVVSRRARLEAHQAVHPIAVPMAGTVVATHATLGRSVRRGDVLLDLDARDQVLQRKRIVADTVSLEQHIAALGAQLDAVRALAGVQRHGSDSKRRKAEEDTAGGRELGRIARERADRTARLGREGLVPRTEADEAARRATAEESRVRGLVAAEMEAGTLVNEVTASADVRLREIESDRIELERQLAAARNAIHLADLSIERMRVRSPVDGRITSSTEPQTGAWLAAGDKLCSIVAAERVEVAAWFPLESMPMIRAGQPASIWINLPTPRARTVRRATVVAVEQDSEDDEFKVRLRLDDAHTSVATFSQGFPAVAVVEVQRVTPLRALLRAAGMVRTGA